VNRRLLTALAAVLLVATLALGLGPGYRFAAADTPAPQPLPNPAQTTPIEPSPSTPLPTDSASDPSSPSPTEPVPTTGAPSTQTPQATTATPMSPTPTLDSPSSSPTSATARATPTPTPLPVITLPATPPAATSDDVPLTSALVALVVLVLAGLLLRELTTKDPASAATPDEPTVALRPTASEDDVLLLMSTAGDALIEAGFDVSDVQSDLRHIAVSHGVRDVQILALPTMLLVSTRSGAGIRTNAVATGDEPLRLHQIEALDDVMTRSRQGLDPGEAMHRIAEIRAERPPFPPLVQLLGSVLATMGLAVLLGSSWHGMLLSGVLGALTGALILLGQRVPMRYQALVTVTAASAVSLTVFLLARLGWSTDIVPSLIAPLVTLLPGALLTTGVIELTSGQMIAGAGRLAAGATQLMLLGLGIVGPALLVGVPALELTTNEPALGTLGPWLAVAAFGVGIVVHRCARPRSMGWMLIVLYVAYGAQVLGGLVLGGALSGFVGALAMTPVADLVARQRGGPPAIVSFTPAFWILVPGALGLMGVATLLSGDDAGRDTVLTTVVTMVSIALGVLVGRALSILVGLRRLRAE
jgi:uncharacterized membrane protein YjjP (DUF1212 family)